MKRALVFLTAGSIFVLFVFLALTQVCLTYPVMRSNDPLKAPVLVVTRTPDSITLADGRTFKIDTRYYSYDFDQALKDSAGKVEVVTENGYTHIYGYRRIFYCGTGRARYIQIPIFPFELDTFERREVAEVIN